MAIVPAIGSQLSMLIGDGKAAGSVITARAPPKQSVHSTTCMSPARRDR